MKRVWPIAATIAVLTAACLAPASATASDSEPVTVRGVTIVLAPYLSWDDVSPASTPALWRLAEKGALASVNARSRVRDPEGGSTTLEGALALSAGAWARPVWDAPAAFTATETYAGGPASEGYRRAFGQSMAPAEIAYLGLPMTQRANDKALVDIVLGTLGQAVRDAGGLTAAIGNSDLGFAGEDAGLQRPAAIAAGDGAGLVAYGDVSVDLLSANTGAPYGRATDPARFKAAFDRVSALAAAHKGPSLVVLDPGDLARASAFAPQVADDVAERQRTAALRELDDVVALADARRGTDGVLIVASQALFADRAGASQGVGPFVIAGPGYSGYATSSSTHRRGLVTNLDITATALDALGIKPPVQVLGNPIVARRGPASVETRANHLTRTNDAYIAIDGLRSTIAAVILGVTLAVFALVVLVSWLAPRLSVPAVLTWSAALKAGLLVVLAVPAASWLAPALVPAPMSPAVLLAAFIMTTVVLAVVAFVASGSVPLRVPVAGVCLLTAFTLIAEQLLGAPLSIVSLLSYSPLLGARYYGMGNEAAAIAFGATLIGVALLLDEWPHAPASDAVRRWGIGVIGAVFVCVAAAPFLGANVGVAIWGTAGFAVAWLLLSGRPVTGRRIVGIVVLVVLVIALFSAIDVLAGGEQTHLGRALAGARQGGLGTLWTIVARKADANVRVLSYTGLTWILAAVAGLAVFARWRPGSDWPALLADNPHLANAITAAAVGGALAFFSEDSGIVIPSLIALYAGVALAWLMVARLAEAAKEGELR